MPLAFLSFQFRLRRITLFAFDISAGCLSLYLAFYLRFEGDIPRETLATFFSLIPFVLFSRAAAYYYFEFYTRFWKYSSLEDLIQILKAVATGTLLILFTAFLYNRFLIPRSVIIIDMMLLIMILGGSRLAWRMYRERFLPGRTLDESQRLKVLILGAGDRGAHLLRYIKIFAPQYQVCGFLDNNQDKLNSSLSGVKVLGDRHSIPKLAKKLEIKEILISTNTILPECLEEIIGICNQCGVKYKIATSITDLNTKEVRISKIKNIDIQDLLGRDPVSLNLASLKNLIQGKRVLVTGAGGSIGSELCRQILEYSPSSLVMMDRCENYLHELRAILSTSHSDTHLSFIFSSITNSNKLESIFSKHQPQLVFHAAAHKHVPLMEDNPDEAVINNIIGTRMVADASEKWGVEKFILVSTDKVVRPSSVMGMTKRVAENFIQHIGRNSKTRFMIVRFGNVLGSNGSVVPLFKQQISEGRSVTVTHPEMERYFMLISEAAQLILQTAAIGEGGNIYLLEMGKPVKIVDLARKMIQLAGYIPDQDIEIKFIGIRPGEKLQEELINPDETAVRTSHKKIKVLKSNIPEIPDFETRLDALYGIAKNGNSAETIKTLWSLEAGEEQGAADLKSIPDANKTSISIKWFTRNTENIINQLPIPIAIIKVNNVNGGYQYIYEFVNSSLAKLNNKTIAEHIGYSVEEVITNEKAVYDIKANLHKVIKSKKSTIRKINIPIEGKNGQLLEFHFPIEYNNSVVGVGAALIDITELVQAKEESEGANKAQSEFLSRMSHEIRTPLNAILSYTQILQTQGFLDSKHRKALKMIDTNVNQLLELINRIPDISKIEAGQIDLNLTDFNLTRLITVSGP